jgi:glycosyltransferase involved in cell wall biosynthesis
LGYVADDDLPWVYRGATMFVYPSLYEGFGFPPLEAMACGTPMIASAGSALEENLRGTDALVPAMDTNALTSAMRHLEVDEARRARVVQGGLERAATFRWRDTARTILDCYGELARDRSDHGVVRP